MRQNFCERKSEKFSRNSAVFIGWFPPTDTGGGPGGPNSLRGPPRP